MEVDVQVPLHCASSQVAVYSVSAAQHSDKHRFSLFSLVLMLFLFVSIGNQSSLWKSPDTCLYRDERHKSFKKRSNRVVLIFVLLHCIYKQVTCTSVRRDIIIFVFFAYPNLPEWVHGQ